MEPFRKRLLKVQTELKAPKSQTNNFGNYKYRSCEDIMEAVKPLLENHGILLTVSDDLVMWGDRHYVRAVATAWDVESDQKIENFAFAREPAAKKGMDESQITGATSSYARKYALNGLLCIDDTKDSDYAPPSSTPPKTQNSLICDECRKPISDIEYQGKRHLAGDIAQRSQERFSRKLCWDCSLRRKNGL